MSIEIRDVRAICTAPEGINLVAVKIETNEPELYGVGCATFAHRYSAVVTVINDYLRPFLIGKDPSNIEDIWQSVMGMSYWRNGPVLTTQCPALIWHCGISKGRWRECRYTSCSVGSAALLFRAIHTPKAIPSMSYWNALQP